MPMPILTLLQVNKLEPDPHLNLNMGSILQLMSQLLDQLDLRRVLLLGQLALDSDMELEQTVLLALTLLLKQMLFLMLLVQDQLAFKRAMLSLPLLQELGTELNMEFMTRMFTGMLTSLLMLFKLVLLDPLLGLALIRLLALG